MTVTAGETNPQAAQPAVVDAASLAREIVGAVATINMQQQASQAQNTRVERVSAFKAKADELLKSGAVDAESLPIMLQLIEAMGDDLTAKQQEQYERAARDAQTKAIHAELGRMVERYAASSESPELIRKLSKEIVQDAINTYNSNGVLVAKYQKDGSVDWNHFDKLVVAEVTKWSGTKGGEESKPAGGPAMKNSAPSGALEPSRELSKDSLGEKQQEIFNSQVSFAIKNMNMSREDAEKRALDLINKSEAKLRAAKR